MQALGLVGLRFRQLGILDVGDRQHLLHLDPGELLQSERIGMRVDAAAHEQIAQHLPGSEVVIW
jgi:hypothetical protein